MALIKRQGHIDLPGIREPFTGFAIEEVRISSTTSRTMVAEAAALIVSNRAVVGRLMGGLRTPRSKPEAWYSREWQALADSLQSRAPIQHS